MSGNPLHTYAGSYDASARLTILRALADMNDGRMNDSMLLDVLHAFGIGKGRAYLRTQLTYLDDEVGAVTLSPFANSIVAELTEAGLDHVERRRVLDGVKRPKPGGA